VADNVSLQENVQGARRMRLVLQHFIPELKMKRQVDKILRDALTLPAGFGRHGFTPQIEVFDVDGNRIEMFHHAKPDLPWFRRVPVWDVRVDPHAETWHPDEDARWVAFRSLVTMDQVDRNPNLIHREDLKATVSIDKRMLAEQSARGSDLGDDYNNFVEIWTVYDKEERKWFAISPGSKKTLREPDDWPIDWDGLPYDYLGFNEQADENVPFPFPEAYRHLQVELNKVRTMMQDATMRQRNIVAVNGEVLADGQADKLSRGDILQMEILLTNGADPKEIAAEFQLGRFQQELLLYQAQIKEDIREVIAQGQMDRAQRINVESATEAANVQQGSDIQQSRQQETFEEFWGGVIRRFAQSLQQTLTQDIIVPILGVADAQAAQQGGDFIQVRPEDIRGEFKYSIRVSSTVAKSEQQELQKALALKQVFNGDPAVDQRLLNINVLEAAGYDSNVMLLSPEQIQATEQALNEQGLTSREVNGTGRPASDPNVVSAVGR
jgi:hypothetical protein